jgi:hypothetical protein
MVRLPLRMHTAQAGLAYDLVALKARGPTSFTNYQLDGEEFEAYRSALDEVWHTAEDKMHPVAMLSVQKSSHTPRYVSGRVRFCSASPCCRKLLQSISGTPERSAALTR